MTTVLLTGASGYLGSVLLRYLSENRPDWDVHATFFSIPPTEGMPFAHYLDVRDPASVAGVLENTEPDIIFHTAALNQSDGATELEATNADGSGYLAQGAAKWGARLVHLSSDVIFDGTRGHYSEADTPKPITPYATSKANAEKAVLETGANAVLVRTSLIYGFKPLDPRTRGVLRGEMTHLFTDEMRCPVWVWNLCEALAELGELDVTGPLHVAGTQALSRYEFGVKLMHALDAPTDHLVAVKSDSSRVTRPRDCTLDVSEAQRLLKTRLLSVDEMIEMNKKR